MARHIDEGSSAFAPEPSNLDPLRIKGAIHHVQQKQKGGAGVASPFS
jgi:hypothetical protein